MLDGGGKCCGKSKVKSLDRLMNFMQFKMFSQAFYLRFIYALADDTKFPVAETH